MMPRLNNDYSDSDDDTWPTVETSVLLGVPDGPLDDIADINDAAVSRIGGHPALLPSREPPFSSSHCKVCSNPCELLVQMWCPFEDSPMDRALYIWGCARASCQGKEGSVRAWRGLRFNDKYAAKLDKKLAKKRQLEQGRAHALALADQQRIAAKSNPFSLKVPSSPDPNAFGLAGQISAEQPVLFPKSLQSSGTEPGTTSFDNNGENLSDTDNDSVLSDKSLVVAMASVTVTESPWKTAPLYSTLYLSTISEYLPPEPKPKAPLITRIDDQGLGDGKGGKDISWASEVYEDSLEMDHVFERFIRRVGCEGEQCVRYELKGTPLPFSSDDVFNNLFPSPPLPVLPVTKPAFTVVHTAKRTYMPSLAPCPVCHAKRVFECQLMPNLINVLQQGGAAEDGEMTDEERQKMVAKMLKGAGTDGNEARGMEWGTCMVFSCEQDCCQGPNGEEAKECWREELVLIQVAI